MSRRAKTVLIGSVILSGFTIWGVHFLQEWERDRMYKGVLRDEDRRREKERQRQTEFARAVGRPEQTPNVHGNENLNTPSLLRGSEDSPSNEKTSHV